MIPKYIVIHHTAVSYRKNPDQWKATNQYHKDKIWGYKNGKPIKTPISSLGYYGGYNYEIAAKGTIMQFRRDGEETVAQYQKNMNNGQAISICLDGYFDIEEPTPEQYEACKKLIIQKMEAYNIKPENIIPHRDLATLKSCPGTRLPDNLAQYFGIVPIIKKEPASFTLEHPTGTPAKRASVLARIARQRVVQKVLNLIAKEK